LTNAAFVNYGCSTMLPALDLPRDPSDGLAAVVALRRLADQLEDAEVARALRDGWTWSLVAEALGVTRQAVHKKHAKRLKAMGVES
jgi:hypothetical protein